jgi:translation initiation factor 2B subunit (eIF-2B alpha/beta/delta family)
MSDNNLRNIVENAEKLDLKDLIQIREALEKAVAKHYHYEDIIMTRQGAPYYT